MPFQEDGQAALASPGWAVKFAFGHLRLAKTKIAQVGGRKSLAKIGGM